MTRYRHRCEIRRPYASSTVLYADVPCVVKPDMSAGLLSARNIRWTTRIDVPAGTDIQCQFAPDGGPDAIRFVDGDEVRIPSGGSERYVAVWVEDHEPGTSRNFRRIYLLRRA